MDRIVYFLFLVLEKIIPLFPLRFSQSAARLWGYFFYYFIPIRKKTAYSNLKLAFPEKSGSEIRRIIKGCYVNVFIVIMEFIYFPRLTVDRLRKLIHASNAELINKKLEEGKGLILISAHFGNWELMAYGVSRLCGEPFNIIVKEQANKMLDKKINEIRELHGNKLIDMSSSLREVLKLLGNNKVVAILGDQSAPRESLVKADFFVKNVPTFEGAARFALKTGAPILFGVPARSRDYSYSLTLHEIDVCKYGGYNDENIKKLTQEHVDLLAEHIRANPDHWLWFHRRFKNVE
jgi:KDO2-lipid IV(A) lauroyltransferase